jgi:GT2 family glycosyltransferase
MQNSPEASIPSRRPAASAARLPFLLYGVLAFSFGIVMYLFGVVMAVPRYLFGLNAVLLPINEWIVWHSGIPVFAGITLALIDLLWLFRIKRILEPLRFDSFSTRYVTVALTAYNDEDSIELAVKDFRQHPLVKAVIVVSNNSTDRTMERAYNAGAVVFNEPSQGYGHCVYRSLTEALEHDDTELIVLCEGDSTFRAYDIDKLMVFAPHADIVGGTRTVERLRQYTTQLTTFMYYGNLFVGKLLEAKHLGKSTITDVGTTFKLCRRSALESLLPLLDHSINLEFNAYFLDSALASGLFLVECPITFHPRVGVSKGGNVSDWRALLVGSRMILGIVAGWRFVPR